MTSSYRNGLGRLGSQDPGILSISIHILGSEHRSHEIHACGHITYPYCFFLAGLRLFAIVITCIRDIYRAQFCP